MALSTAPLPTGVLESCTTYYNQAPSAGQSLTFVIFNVSGPWDFTIANSFTVTASATTGFQTFTAPPIAITAGQLVGYWAASGIEPGSGGQTASGYSIANQTTLPSGSTAYEVNHGGYPVSCNVATNMATPNIRIAAPTQSLSAQLTMSDAPLAAGVLQTCSTYYYAAPAAGQSLTFVIFNPNGNNTGTVNNGGNYTESFTIANSFTVTAAASAGLQTFAAPPIAITAGQTVGLWAASGTEPGFIGTDTTGTGADAFGAFFLNDVTTLPSGPTTYTPSHGDYPVACVVSGGQFTYSPAAGTVPAAGTDPLSVTFTPTNTTSYSVATATVGLIVTGSTVACPVGP